MNRTTRKGSSIFTFVLLSLIAFVSGVRAEDPLPSPVCYIQTEDGQMVDLTYLCGGSEREEEQRTVRSTPTAAPAPAQRRGRGGAVSVK